MPVVTVRPVNTINVRVGQARQPIVSGSATFTGASSQAAAIALAEATLAIQEANNALALANNALQTTGGEITGDLIVDGTFTAVIDGGTFS